MRAPSERPAGEPPPRKKSSAELNEQHGQIVSDFHAARPRIVLTGEERALVELMRSHGGVDGLAAYLTEFCHRSMGLRTTAFLEDQLRTSRTAMMMAHDLRRLFRGELS